MDLRRNQAGELARFPQHGDDETPFLAQVRNVQRVKAIVRGGFAGRACQPGGLDLLRSEARERTPFCGGSSGSRAVSVELFVHRLVQRSSSACNCA